MHRSGLALRLMMHRGVTKISPAGGYVSRQGANFPNKRARFLNDSSICLVTIGHRRLLSNGGGGGG